MTGEREKKQEQPRYKVCSCWHDKKKWGVRDTQDNDRLVFRYYTLEKALKKAEKLNQREVEDGDSDS